VRSLQWQSALCLREKCCIFYDWNYLSFRKHKKYPLSGGKAPFAFVKNGVQIGFYMIAIIFRPPPPPSLTFPEKMFSGALFIPKVPLETTPHPQSFDASYAPGG
jgi:hypothetical protein